MGALVDPGSAITILSKLSAAAVGLRCRASTDTLPIGGVIRKVCYRKVDLHVPDTDCLLEKARVAVIAKDEDDDIPGVILGADFIQRTGGFLDYRLDSHAIACDSTRRDRAPEEVVEAKRVSWGFGK